MIAEFIKRFRKPRAYQPKDEFWTRLELDKALKRNGSIMERAKIEGRSLTYTERQIVSAVRNMASTHFSKQMINMIEMEGERNKSIIHQPTKVKAKFAYWSSGEFGYAPEAQFHVMESNHPAFPIHGNFGESDFRKSNLKIPSHPTFEKWDRQGRRVFRG